MTPSNAEQRQRRGETTTLLWGSVKFNSLLVGFLEVKLEIAVPSHSVYRLIHRGNEYSDAFVSLIATSRNISHSGINYGEPFSAKTFLVVLFRGGWSRCGRLRI